MANNNKPNWLPSAPIPGQSLTKAPGSTPWQKPPKFAKLNDACNFVFDQICQPPKLMQILTMLKSGIPVEALARIIIFSGFSTGLWTPDLGMLMARPIMYMLAGICKRSGVTAKLTAVDRSGMKELSHLKGLIQSASGEETPSKPITEPKNAPAMAKGFLTPMSGQ